MAEAVKSKKKPPSRQLYHSAKISDYRFRKVLWGFVRDLSATDTAKETGLSVNSVTAIFRKIRVYFFDLGIFKDYYDGQDPREAPYENDWLEKLLIEFHFERVKAKQGLKSPWEEPFYHFAETYWRFFYKLMAEQRPSENIHAVMEARLLEFIRACGPIGGKIIDRRKALAIARKHQDQYVLWLERNSPEFKDEAKRAELRTLTHNDAKNG